MVSRHSFIEENNGGNHRGHYAPRHFRSSCSFTLGPGRSVLVSLDEQRKPPGHVASRIGCGKKRIPCRLSHPTGALGLLVTNVSAGPEAKILCVAANTGLDKLLGLQEVASRFVVGDTTAATEMSRKTGRRGVCCPAPTLPEEEEEEKGGEEEEDDDDDDDEEEEEENSCTESCDHSDIDDGIPLD